jgi:hypothetical protein
MARPDTRSWVAANVRGKPIQKITVACCCLLVFLACGAQARENTDVPEVAFPELEEWMRKPSELGVMAAGGVGYDGAIKILLPMVC